jgi:hypothetical protein
MQLLQLSQLKRPTPVAYFPPPVGFKTIPCMRYWKCDLKSSKRSFTSEKYPSGPYFEKRPDGITASKISKQRSYDFNITAWLAMPLMPDIALRTIKLITRLTLYETMAEFRSIIRYNELTHWTNYGTSQPNSDGHKSQRLVPMVCCNAWHCTSTLREVSNRALSQSAVFDLWDYNCEFWIVEHQTYHHSKH